MRNEKETKAKLLASAKKEFLEKGYMQASLRNICKNAGVTTGALYFFFQDKEDLFASLVEEPLKQLYEVMEKHYAEEEERVKEVTGKEIDIADDILAANQIIHYMYVYYDEFQLIINHSQGSRFEKSVERLVEISEKQLRLMSDEMSKVTNCAKVDDYIIHWFSHMQVDMFLYMLKHEKSEEAAQQHIEQLIRILISGWLEMFR